MERRFKGLVAINDVLDDRYQKLSDKYHDLELSHKRKKECLEEIWQYCNFEIRMCCSPVDVCSVPVGVFELMAKRIDDALFCDGRMREKPIKKKKITMRDVKAKKK